MQSGQGLRVYSMLYPIKVSETGRGRERVGFLGILGTYYILY